MVKLNVDFRVGDARQALTEFALLVGYSDMKRSLDKVHNETRRRRAMSIGLLNRYAIPLGLHRAYQYVRSTGRAKSPLMDPYTFAACTFAIAAVSVSRCLSEDANTRLSGMVRQGLSLQGDARRLQHEFAVAAHFAKNGWDITFVDLEGQGQFDYLVSNGKLEMDVECKTISADKGNAIHMFDSLNFMDNVCDPLLDVFEDGWWTVDLTFDVGLPKNRPDQLALARQLAQCMKDERTVLDFQGGSATLQFQPMPQLSDDKELEAFANEVMVLFRSD